MGLLGLRIFEATGADNADLGEEDGHHVLRLCGKAPRCPGAAAARSLAGYRPGNRLRAAGRSCLTPVVPGWIGTRSSAACAISPRQPAVARTIRAARGCLPTVDLQASRAVLIRLLEIR